MTDATSSHTEITARRHAARPPMRWPRLWWMAFICLFWSAPSWSQTLNADVDRNSIGEGETLQLILTARGADDGQSPDVEPLRKDFDILGTHQTSRIQLTNGHTDSSREWRFVLAPKRSGTLTIPALTLGALRSHPLTVTVNKMGNGANGKHRDVLLEASVDTTSPYVQAQVVLTLRLLHSVPLREAALGKLELAEAVVERLGDDVNFQVERDGKRFEGIERRYAIFPQRSGSLTIPPILMTAKVPDKRSRGVDPLDPFGDPFNLLQPLQTIRVRSNELVLKVRPPPATGQTAAWLPASNLTVDETWSTEPPVLRVGEPVTRTLTLRAEGLTAAQLPVLESGNLTGLKVYTDQPALQTEAGRRGIVGTSQLKWAVVPSQEGKLTLPEIRVPWWDTNAGQMKAAVLPARTLNVLAAAQSDDRSAPASQTTPTNAADLAPASHAATDDSDSLFQPWRITSFALALLWLSTVWLWLRDRRRELVDVPLSAQPSKHQSRAVARALLGQACKRGDLAATRDAVLTLAASRWPQDPPRSLATTATRVDGLARDALLDLEARLYGTLSGSWNGQTFLKAIGPILERPPHRARAVVANPLVDLAETRAEPLRAVEVNRSSGS